MVPSTALLVTFTTLYALLLIPAQARCPRTSECAFRWCNANEFSTILQTRLGPRIFQRDEGVASTPFVCRKIVGLPGQLGYINSSVDVSSTGNPLISTGSRQPFRLLHRYRPTGLAPRFPRKYFFLAGISFPRLPGKKGVARRRPMGSQDDFLDDTCIKLPIGRHFLINEDGTRVAGSRGPENCILFSPLIPKLLVELTWDNGDNLDISLQEPLPGILISKDTRVSSRTKGRLVRDQNIDTCDRQPVGREQIVYTRGKSSPLRGVYTITVKRTVACSESPVKFSVAVIANGENIFFATGTSFLPSGSTILVRTFTFDG